ncbi:unnamed protein product [Camellia sinensis]
MVCAINHIWVFLVTNHYTFELKSICSSGGNDASHSAEATARRGSSSFARPDVVLCCVVNECV